MRSRIGNSVNRFDQPPSSAEDGAPAPSRKTLDAVATRVTLMGSKSATAYHAGLTRQRTIRRRRPTTPDLPRVNASTASAARKGPKDAMGVGERSIAYRIHPHHERAMASTKNAISGCSFTTLVRRDIILVPPFRLPA
jgi:hypothetical protein